MKRLSTSRAAGLLAEFDAAGVLAPADIHVATRLGVLTGESDERVLLAVALTVRGTRQGSVVLDLATAADTITPETDETPDEGSIAGPVEPVVLPWPDPAPWIEACRVSPVVTGAAGGPPLRQVGSRLWLDRYWQQEIDVAEDLLRRSAARPDDIDPAELRADLDDLFADAEIDDQRRAVAVAALSRVSVIAGGPGTGKTTTLAQLIAVLHRRLGADLRIALAAPTGKAAARLEAAVRDARGQLAPVDRERLARVSARTLHRLLDRRPGNDSRFKHDRNHHLPYDVVIVDESSMVPLTMMARLVEALAPHTRLVLVGDPDQLASVEAGAVLGDLVDDSDPGNVTATFGVALQVALPDPPPATRPVGRDAELRSSVSLLTRNRRTGGVRVELARMIRAGASDDVLALLRSGAEGIRFHEVADDEPMPAGVLNAVCEVVVGHELALATAALAGDAPAALAQLDRHRLLCAHRNGPRGVDHWTELAQQWFAPALDRARRADGHYAGRPLLVTANDYEIELYNGDTGVVIHGGHAGDDDGLVAVFNGRGGAREVPLVRLGDVRPVHAMTVHKAQGSQFDRVTVVLPLASSPLATRQTLYTAVTRAVAEVSVVGSVEAITECVTRPIARATGLRDRLAGALPFPAAPAPPESAASSQ